VRIAKSGLLVLLLASGALSPAHAAAQAAADGDLRADIDTAAAILRRDDPELLQPAIRTAFDRATAAVLALPDTTPRSHLVAAWARTIALLHDGHTQILFLDPAVGFHRYPVRLYWFEEGLYVTAARPDLAELLGARLVSIDGVPAAEAVGRIRPYIHGDNDMNVRDVLPSRLLMGEFLEAAGVSPARDHAAFAFREADGSTRTVRLDALPADADIPWTTALDALPRKPLYQTRPGDPYWYRYLPERRLMYVQYDAVENDEDDPFAAFCQRLFAAVDSTRADHLVLDIRRNNGGDNTLLLPLVTGLIRSRVNRPGRLFVITGRLTFSAAVNLAAQIEHFTHATFVGEPTAAPANHYGETRLLTLPRTGIRMLMSTLYWQSAGDAKDHRPWIPPSIPAPPTASDYFAGRDPAMTAIERALTARAGG